MFTRVLTVSHAGRQLLCIIFTVALGWACGFSRYRLHVLASCGTVVVNLEQIRRISVKDALAAVDIFSSHK